ncbi:2-keto-4-pentenoate hydratase [Hyphococcus sp.]|uniref:2-keto-4-pentenoate hydratase n=1 Tax=Hyphococcus sp. TaxID=2038636 RepID=UPI003CCBC0A2
MAGLEELAVIVDEAQRAARAIPQLTKDHPDLSVSDAYAIQALSVARRIARGEKRIGVKMGLTSRAKMIQVGVEEAAWGRLTDAMLLEEGGVLKKSAFVHPRLEPEIVFLLKKRLSGKVSALEAMAAVEAVAPAMEVIDSRYENFKFALPDVVADNTSSSGLVIGAWRSPEIDVSNLGMVLSVNGRPKEIGSSAAILGHPLRSLVAAARMSAEWGEALEPGHIVMAGGATAAHPASVGETISLEVQNLGGGSINVEA